jgi:hypothetical protein
MDPLLEKPGRVAAILTKLSDRVERVKRAPADHRSQRCGKAKCIESSDEY